MGLYKQSQVRAVNDRLEAFGTIAWRDEKTAAEACALLADQLPDSIASDAAPLTHENALKIAQELVGFNTRGAQYGLAASPGEAMLRKHAAAQDITYRAVETTRGMMQEMDKQADALIMQGGQHTNRPGESPESIAQLDQRNRPQGSYLAGLGNTAMQVPSGAVVGREAPHPSAPSHTAPTPNSVTMHSKAAEVTPGLLEKLKGLPAGIADAWGSLSTAQQAALIGGGVGAAGGATAGALSDDEHRLRNALVGGAAGAGVGAGVGYGGAKAYERMPQAREWMADKLQDAAGSVRPDPNAPLPGQLALKFSNDLGLNLPQTYAFMQKMSADVGMLEKLKGLPAGIADAWGSLSTAQQAALIGGGVGAAGGATAGAFSDDEHRLRNALVGGAAGAGVGAGVGYGGAKAYERMPQAREWMADKLQDAAGSVRPDPNAPLPGQLALKFSNDLGLDLPQTYAFMQKMSADVGMLEKLKSLPAGIAEAWGSLSTAQQAALIGGGVGAAGGATAGALSDDEHRLRNALVGGAAGAGVGAGVGYGGAKAYEHMPQAREWMADKLQDAAGSVRPDPNAPLPGQLSLKLSHQQGLKLAAELGMNQAQTYLLLNKIAAGGSLTDSTKNTLAEAAKHDQTAALDQKNRPAGKYHEGAGKTTLPNSGQQLAISKTTEQPGAKGKSPDTVPANETKSAAFMTMFDETAREVGAYLPTHMDQNTKIAHVRAMMGLSTDERANYIRGLNG